MPDKYWALIGIVQTEDFAAYMIRLLTVPIVTLFIPTFIMAAILFKKPVRFLSIVFLITLFGAVFSCIGALGHQGTLINQSVAGFYILGLAVGFLMEYLESRNNLYFGLFFGPFIAFIFIITMWLTSGKMDIFKGIFRYLTIASIFSCLFLGNILTLLHQKMYRKKMFFIVLSFLPYLFLIQIVRLNISEIENYYYYSFASGYGWEEQNKMRQLLLPYYQNLSLDNPRIIYADIHTDAVNTQYYSNTIYAGWDAWPMYWPNVGFKPNIIPYLAIDYSTLKSWVTKRDGKAGIFYPYSFLSYRPTFYKSENFFAVRFVDRKLIDITDQVKEELKLSD